MKFEIGEVAIYTNPDSKFYGVEVEVLSELRMCYCRNLITGEMSAFEGYAITDLYPHERGHFVTKPEHLRKKRPPLEDKKRENPDVIESQNKDYDPTLTPWSPPGKEIFS